MQEKLLSQTLTDTIEDPAAAIEAPPRKRIFIHSDPSEMCEKNAATESLQHYFSNLVVAIQDPVLASNELYSMKLISWPMVENVLRLDLPKSDKNFQLLSAIRSQLATNPSGIEVFIQVLQTKLNLQEIAKGMEEKYQGELVVHPVGWDQDSGYILRHNDYRKFPGISVCKQTPAAILV